MRTSLVWVGMACVVIAAPALAKKRHQATAQVLITHTPVATHELGTELQIKSVITAPSGVYLPTVFYRQAGARQYFSMPMVAVPDEGGDLYATAIPGLFITKDIEYYIEARDLKNFTESTQAGNPNAPFRVTAVNKKVLEPRVAVTSDPSDADITLDGKAVGHTPFIQNLDPGEHTFVLSKDKFKTAERTVMAAEGRDVDLSFPLRPAAKPPVVAITSTPDKARITLDDAEVGTTPLIQDAPSGTHALGIWVDGYQKQIRDVTFTPDRNTELAINLQKLPPQPVLAVTSQPAGATLTVDGTDMGKTPYLGPLAAGEHELALVKGGYRGLGVEVVMPGDRDLDLRYNLEVIPANPPPPQVAFGTDPAGAEVKVGGKSLGQTPLLQALPPGDHQLVISAPGYLPYTRKLWIPKDHDVEVSIALVVVPPPPGPSAIDLAADPEATILTIDGKAAGTGKWSGKLDAGPHTIEAKAEGFRSVHQPFSVIQGQSASIKLALTPLPPEAKAPLLTTTSEPKGAKVLFDGQELGVTPFSGEVKPGEHTVTLVLPEFKNHDERVSIPDNRDFELRIRAALEPSRKAIVLPQVNRRAPPPPSADTQTALAQEHAEARKSGSADKAALLTPTTEELAAMCQKAAPPTPTTTAPAQAVAPAAPAVEIKHELLKPGLAPILATAVGVAAVGTGVYFTVRANEDATQIRAAANPTAAAGPTSDYQSSEIASLALYGGGGLIAAGVDGFWLLRSYLFTPSDDAPMPATAGSAGP